SECPPTYGVPLDLVIGIMAGGDRAIRKAVENAEDDPNQAWIDLQAYDIDELDSLIGIAASGRTPYVIGGLNQARNAGILTGCIVCNVGSKVAAAAEYPVEIVVGPEFVTGSTRMKSGTAQKLALNMISTSVMIQLGRVQGNKMVDMQMTNFKLVQRAIRMVREELPHITLEEAQALLDAHGSVRNAVEAGRNLS
ncbi:MAG TPA: N-acetylmuramic acid 6-phosphate etherase, partial [Runella sp.]|nr:N-acetylmuramic acid 6-phosphate etherase [Runella sp.]